MGSLILEAQFEMGLIRVVDWFLGSQSGKMRNTQVFVVCKIGQPTLPRLIQPGVKWVYRLEVHESYSYPLKKGSGRSGHTTAVRLRPATSRAG